MAVDGVLADDEALAAITLTDGIMAGELDAVEEPQGIDADDVARIHDAVESLPPMQRACLRLSELEGFTSGEVGAMLCMSDATMRVHAQTAPSAYDLWVDRQTLSPPPSVYDAWVDR